MVQKGLLMKGHFCAYLYALSLFFITLLFPIKTFADGWTPTDGGLVVDLEPGAKFMLSVMVDDDDDPDTPDKEYFVCDYSGYNGGHFKYSVDKNNNYGVYLKLIEQDDSNTISPSSKWTVEAPLQRGSYSLGGICYTMWGAGGNTLKTAEANGGTSNFRIMGVLTNDANNNQLCDVVFVQPTNNSRTISFDPENTLKRVNDKGDKFNGEKGFGHANLPYREVYWLAIPKDNNPKSYTNAALVTFNTTTSTIKWYKNKSLSVDAGKAYYAYADHTNDKPHHLTQRTIFRLYILETPQDISLDICPDSYFFATNTQDYKAYRKTNTINNGTAADSTDKKKIYTIDWMNCMERIGTTTKYQTDLMQVPENDSTYFYVGKKDTYVNNDNKGEMHLNDAGTAVSQFKQIRTLPIDGLTSYIAPENLYGRMVVDTTSTEQNIGVAFRPAGFFLRTGAGSNKNIRMKQTGEYEWTCEEMWHITEAYANLYIKATMFSGTEYSETDEGIDIPGWSVMVQGTDVPVTDGRPSIVGCNGWARIHTNNTDPNGHMEFVPANPDRHIHYDNNTYTGEQIPDQYPMYGEYTVTIESPRLVGGFLFKEWNSEPDGSGTPYTPGTVVTLPEGTTTLYAIATYTGTIHVALSFLKDDGKRYFLTHPGTAAPRYSRARNITEWTDAYQGMANADNVENNYINTYKLLHDPDLCGSGEMVLDPRREMRHGAIDSLEFYENFAPAEEEYLGLYYTDPNVILANTSWAGLFTSTAGWPDFRVADVQNTKLKSTHYLHKVNDVLTRDERENSGVPYVKYNAADNQFDGEADINNATVFQLSRVRVADEHYVVIPDTTDEWINSITFGYHESEQTEEVVWSKLIGKQLMAVTKVGNDTVYFHPNPDKILTTWSALRLSLDYRLTENFTYIRDSRVVSSIADEDRPHVSTAANEFGRIITSGMTSPKEVQYRGAYVDMVDTLRISLNPTGTGKIKAYYGRWKDGASGLHIKADGSRYRDILVRTKTYHYGATQTRLVLTPEHDNYTVNPLAGTNKTINFTLTKQTVRQLFDVDGNKIGDEEVTSSEDVTPLLTLGPSACSFAAGSTYFAINNSQTVSDHVTVYTRNENDSEGENNDTLIISTTVTLDAVEYTATARVPLLQTTTYFNELIWSAVADGKRYYIMANSDGLLFHQYKWDKNTLYKINTTTQLKVGAASSDVDEYITPWKFEYVPGNADQLKMWTEYGVNKSFYINGNKGDVSTSDTSALSYRYVDIYRNENGNEEELIRLKYGSDKWLKFQITSGNPEIVLQDDSLTATVFSWGYMDREYYLQNNGTYPDKDYAEFFYNRNSSAVIQTRYKGYRLYSMLIDNKLTYLCREDENDIADLVDGSGDWLTDTTFTLIRDARAFEGGAKSSGLTISTDPVTLKTSITPIGTSPTDVKIGNKYVNIVDTLDVRISLLHNAPEYRFAGDWKSFKSIEDAHLKIPLIRRTYHEAAYDSLVCTVEHKEYNYAFPSRIVADENDEHTFTLHPELRTGRHVLNIYNEPVALIDPTSTDVTAGMDLTNTAYAEIRLVDEYGNTPSWCQIIEKGANTIKVKALQSGIRSPRLAYIYLACLVDVGGGTRRFVSFRLTVSQASLFQFTNNQYLVHTKGASGDALMTNGMQQAHTNRRILYYYNPTNINHSPDQRVELPVRERAYYGWWRWYRESDDREIGDTDVPDSLWVTPPRNTGKFNFPYRTIGRKVAVDPEDPESDSILVTMGRYTVFHYKALDYANKADPPSKSPEVCPPTNKDTVIYAVDLSNYYDNLPLSMKNLNQVDTAAMEKLTAITEPTLSLREIFELHPWTEMAERLESYKSSVDETYSNEQYLEDHMIMAPTGNRLLLSTEQRYMYENLQEYYDPISKVTYPAHSESLLGYYMRDDNWSTSDWSAMRKDTMIWCGGWDVDCGWYTYDPGTQTYDTCTFTITKANDFLEVPARSNIRPGYDADTVYYCLRSRSQKTTGTPGTTDEVTVDGDYWFNICRYMVIYVDVNKYGPKLETKNKGITKAIITNDEIEQNYEVLERLNFDYNKPGSDYTIYPHPLPWADGSYGFMYPESPSLPHNRYHDQSDFPNPGEYGIINRIPNKSHWASNKSYWHAMEQHGGAENGYMIYCDGMASAGQVAALTLNTTLCAGQKMFFSGYVANVSNQTGKANPNFIISVQGSEDGTEWDDITSYMTGDIQPSDKWYQIYFPINHHKEDKSYAHFRVRIYNEAANFDGNDFVIDDMCIFATKPPVIAYQANTACKENNDDEDSPSHILLRVDYQGIIGDGFNDAAVYYTIKKVDTQGHTSFVDPVDGYLAREVHNDTICGRLFIPRKDYEPTDPDSIFVNMNQLVDTFDVSTTKHNSNSSYQIFNEGYIFENLDGQVRPVKYIIHSAVVNPVDTFTVHMSSTYSELLSSICGMTSHLNVSNKMMLELNGEEQPETEQFGLCANSTYNIGLRVKGSLYLDNTAPIDLDGSCINDWLLYGDTAEVSSKELYGYKYSDIVKVVKDILRCDPPRTTNANQFASTLADVSRNEMQRMKNEQNVALDTTAHPYDILADLVNKGFLKLYQAKSTATVYTNDSVQFVIFPILGTGTDAMLNKNVEVCPLPIFVKLKPAAGTGAPLTLGGMNRDKSEMNQPLIVLADATTSGQEIKIRVDSIMSLVGIYSVELRTTDDPNFREGVHSLAFTPDLDYPATEYYKKGDTITFYPASTNNYQMKPGYSYEYDIVMQTATGSLTIDPLDPNSCRVGTVPFTVSIVPDYLRWDPQDATSTQWNNPGNWIGVDQNNQPLPTTSRFAPLSSTVVIIPTMTEGKPYPELPDLATPSSYDSVKQVGFTYNTCEYIRFLPGAAIGQQQRLNYSNAIIDMSTPQGKWAFRSAPVKGLISGDLFMANADLNGETKPWEVGGFDAAGRNHNTGNASFWLSVYSKTTVHYGNGVDVKNDTTTSGEWSKVTNGLTLSLPPAQGWAIYTKTKSEKDAAIRLPKNDDRYYYFYASGDVAYDYYEQNLQSMRKTLAGGTAGKFAFQPDGSSQSYTLSKEASSTSFVFGNPTMGFIDIWGFLKDNNSLKEQISYIDAGGIYRTITKSDAEYLPDSPDTISNQKRYLPPMHAILITASSASASLPVTLNANRVVVSPSNKVRQSAPRRSTGKSLPQGIMTVTAINPVSNRCISQLRLGQGYHNAIISGEDAVLSGINIGQAPTTSNPATPFNIYAAEDGYGLSTDLLDSIVNVPISFHMSNLPYKPTTQLWFTGVNSINGPLVLYDALTDTERPIMDGICINIQTPETSHEIRYYIRRYGYKPGNNNPDVTTDVETTQGHESQAMKILQNGHVLILRNGHVYTMYGQQIK